MTPNSHTASQQPLRPRSRRRLHQAPDRFPALVAMTAVLAYQALSVAAVAVNPQWNPLTRQLSEYALGHQGWLQAAAFLASAVAYAALFTALRSHVHGVVGRAGLGILAYCVLATTGVALFVTDPLSTPATDVSLHGALHVLFGGTALVLLPVAALLLTRSLARATTSPPSKRTLNWVALLPLTGFALIWLPEVAGLLPARGWPDRVLFLTYSAWVIAVAAPLGRRADQRAWLGPRRP